MYLSYGSIPQTDAAGNDLGTYNPRDLALGAGWARSYGPLSAGVSARYISSKIIDSASTFALGAGAQYRASSELRLGAALDNLGPGLSFGGSSDPLPFAFRAGSSYLLTPALFGELDLVFERDRSPSARLGFDWAVYAERETGVDLRAGYDTGAALVDGFGGASFGLGVRWSTWRFDYALAPRGELGLAHRLGIGYRIP
jgi:hypothetical protein